MTDNTISLAHAESDAELRACHPTMRELRPQLANAEDLVAAVRRQRPQGYRLLAARQEGEVVGLAGYRRLDNLIHGRFVYIDDLVVTAVARSSGVGANLIAAVREIAKSDHCDRLVLDTALANALGQRFYFRCGLLAGGMHFAMNLK